MTATPTTTHRARRGRLLVVDERPLPDSLPVAVAPRVERVGNLFEALGEIMHSSASAPIEAIVLHSRTLSTRPAMAAESIRRLDPSLLMYLIIPDDAGFPPDEGETAFDGVFIEPLTSRMVAEILGEPWEEKDEPAAAAASTRSTPHADSPSSVLRVVDDPPEFPLPLGRPTNGLVEAPGSSAPGSSEPFQHAEAGSTAVPPGALGDTDLVEAVLEHPDRVPSLAMRLLMQETGWTSAVLVPRSHDVDGPSLDSASAEVVYAGEDHGRLAAPGDAAESTELKRWAGWLARWLSLASTQQALRAMAYTDGLTGAWNRRYVDAFLPKMLDIARRRRQTLTLMVFDVDDLKLYNDHHGHDAGDEVLKETVRLLKSVVRRGDRVCRTGGDEFVVIFAHEEPKRRPDSTPLESVEAIARRFQAAVCQARFPKLGLDAPGRVSISAGLATFPWDGLDAETLLCAADRLALESKRKGKNALTIGSCAANALDVHDSAL